MHAIVVLVAMIAHTHSTMEIYLIESAYSPNVRITRLENARLIVFYNKHDDTYIITRILERKRLIVAICRLLLYTFRRLLFAGFRRLART